VKLGNPHSRDVLGGKSDHGHDLNPKKDYAPLQTQVTHSFKGYGGNTYKD
jgi:hypothetical protein